MKCNEMSRNAPRFFSECGCNLRQLYKSIVKKDGTIVLEPAGFQDTDQFIESFRESTELRTIIARYLNGDENAFNMRPVFFGDQMDMPDNLQQAFEIFKTAESAFGSVPNEFKAMYDNDFFKWINDFGSEQFRKSLGEGKPGIVNDQEQIKEGDVKSE